MHHCLHIPEVVQCIASYLRKVDAYHLAITCKDLLEPCLDEIWREIDSFEPLIACLPGDLWLGVGTQSQGEDEVTILDHGREFQLADLRRYTTCYASRIRSIALEFGDGTKTLSNETLHGLQLITGCQPGALSPLLKEFGWHDADGLAESVGRDYALWFSTHMSLFIGEKVEQVSATLFFEDPAVHKVAFHSGLQRCEASLKNLWISGKEAIYRCLQSFSLEMLDTLTIHDVDGAILPHLATLPRLRHLTIASDGPQIGILPPPLSPLTTPLSVVEPFRSLRRLEVSAIQSVLDIRHVLPSLSRTKQLQSLEWDFRWEDLPLPLFQEFLNTLEEHSDRLDLVTLIFHNNFDGRREEPIEMYPRRLELWPLRTFNKLQELRIHAPHSINVTPTLIADIPSFWPQLRHLYLSPHLHSSHPPSIDHTHILELSRRLPNLQLLGIQFDASCIMDQDGIASRPSRLNRLIVGRSPICSPSGVVSFLRSNYPELETLEVSYIAKPKDDGLFKARWDVVWKGWSETRTRP